MRKAKHEIASTKDGQPPPGLMTLARDSGTSRTGTTSEERTQHPTEPTDGGPGTDPHDDTDPQSG